MTDVQAIAGAAPVPAAGDATKTQRKLRWPIWALLAAIAVGGAAAIWWGLKGDASIQYISQPAARGSVVRAITASGTVNPVITVQVGTYVSGVVQERFCDYNTVVKKGQLCAKIDPRVYAPIVEQDAANLAMAKAQLAKDVAALAYAKVSYERNQRLVGTLAVSKDALDSSKNVYDQAQAQVALDHGNIALREAELKTANVNLDFTNIRSPVDGTVVSRNVEMGQTVAASFQTPTLFLIAADLTKMQVDTNISESDVGALEIDDSVSFTVEAFAKRKFEGTLWQIRQAPQSIQNVVTYDAVVAAPNPDLLLKPGMTATVRLVTDRRDDVLRVPSQALRYVPTGVSSAVPVNTVAPTGERIYVLRDGKLVPVNVEAGLDDDTYTEVVKGELKPGDQVVLGEAAAVNRSGASGQAAGPRAPRL